MHNCITLLCNWDEHNIVNQLYSNFLSFVFKNRYRKNSVKAYSEKLSWIRGGWGDTTAKSNMVARIGYWNRKRTLVENWWTPNKVWNLVKSNIQSRFLSFDKQDINNGRKWRKGSWGLSILSLHLFCKLKMILKLNSYLFNLLNEW